MQMLSHWKCSKGKRIFISNTACKNKNWSKGNAHEQYAGAGGAAQVVRVPSSQTPVLSWCSDKNLKTAAACNNMDGTFNMLLNK
jgi:hypothetical protein